MSKLALMALMLTSAFASIDGRMPAFAGSAQPGLVPVSDDGIYDRDDDDDDDDDGPRGGGFFATLRNIFD